MKILHLEKQVCIDEISYILKFFQSKNVKMPYEKCIFSINYSHMLDEFDYRDNPWFGFYISVLSSWYILDIKLMIKSRYIEFKFFTKDY